MKKFWDLIRKGLETFTLFPNTGMLDNINLDIDDIYNNIINKSDSEQIKSDWDKIGEDWKKIIGDEGLKRHGIQYRYVSKLNYWTTAKLIEWSSTNRKYECKLLGYCFYIDENSCNILHNSIASTYSNKTPIYKSLIELEKRIKLSE